MLKIKTLKLMSNVKGKRLQRTDKTTQDGNFT